MRSKELVKLERSNRRKFTLALLLLLLNGATSRLDLFLLAGVLGADVEKLIMEMHLAAEELADEDFSDPNEAPSLSIERQRQIRVAARKLVLAVAVSQEVLPAAEFKPSLQAAIEEQAARIARITETETFTAYNAKVLANSEGLKCRYEWNSTLDKMTCSQCASLNGRTWNNISDVPSCPQHIRCRCHLRVIQ